MTTVFSYKIYLLMICSPSYFFHGYFLKLLTRLSLSLTNLSIKMILTNKIEIYEIPIVIKQIFKLIIEYS